MRGLGARRGRRFGAAGAILALALLLAPPAASAENTLLQSFSAQVVDRNGDPYTQAGGHPFELRTEMEFVHRIEDGVTVMDENPRTTSIDLPAGFRINPEAAPRCTHEQFNLDMAGGCPASTQVGQADGVINTSPIFNLVPGPGEIALLGVRDFILVRYIHVTMRADGGLRLTELNRSQVLALETTSMSLWGIPADHIPDFQGSANAFLTNPVSCSGPLTTVLRGSSWQYPDDRETLLLEDPIGATGCAKLGFEADADVAPGTSAADSPGGLSISLKMARQDALDPITLAPSQLRDAAVRLPPGSSLNPAMADGRSACSAAEIGLGSSAPAACPDAAKLGAALIESPMLGERLEGGVYLAEAEDASPGGPLGVYVAAGGEGVQVKVAGEIRTDPDSGRVTIALADVPQLPISELRLRFFGGPRAPFATPVTCGVKRTSAMLDPWSGNSPVEADDSFEIDSGPGGSDCAATRSERPFDPGLVSGLLDPTAGSSSDFILRVSRGDGEQEIAAIAADLPAGVAARLGDVPLCADAAAAAGDCAERSRVGSASIRAGAGSSPLASRGGAVHLAGPYDGAPLSLAIVLPVRAGVLDLGELVVRAAVHVDPRDAHLRVVTDPIPRSLGGVPLRLRRLELALDRPGLLRGPTSCAPDRIGAVVRGASGASAEPSYRFQVAGCRDLGFRPKLSLRYVGKQATGKRGRPGLEANLRTRAGDANLKRAKLALPGVALDRAALRRACTVARYAADDCGKRSRVGAATVKSLLGSTLRGDVYLISGKRGHVGLGLDLGGAFDIDLRARLSAAERRARIAFNRVPDASLAKLELSLDGGKKSLLVNRRDVCADRKLRRAKQRLVAQSGKRVKRAVKIKAACGKR